MNDKIGNSLTNEECYTLINLIIKDSIITSTIGQKALIYAIEKNDIKLVEYLLEHKVTIKPELTPFSIVKSEEMANLLLHYGINVNSKNEDKKTSLIIAVDNGNIDIIKFLINNKANINETDEFNWTALMHAVANDSISIVELLLNNKANLNILSSSKRTALLIASESGNMEIVKLLIDKGADTKVIDDNEFGMLTYAVKKHHDKLIDYILNDETIELSLEDINNALIYSNDIELSKKLLQKGADINSVDLNSKQTPLMTAVINNNLELAKYLLEYSESNIPITRNNPYGANPNLKDCNDKSILYHAKDNYQMLELLLSHGANPDIRTDRKTLLFLQSDIMSGISITKLLLEYHADPNVRNMMGETPLMMAVITRSNEIAKLLICYGADIDIKNLSDKTALDICEEHTGTSEVKKVLKHAKRIKRELIKRGTLTYKIEELDPEIIKINKEESEYVERTINEAERLIKTLKM